MFRLSVPAVATLMAAAAMTAALAACGCGSAGTRAARRTPHTRRTHGSSMDAAAGTRAASKLVPIGAGLSGPAGLKAALYAKGPPTVAAFALDGAGRLWLTAAGLQSHAHDGVYLLTGRGAPARRVLSGLNDPLGIHWYEGKLYVASVGRVDAYWGFDGARFAHRRTILAGPLPGGENNLLAMGPGKRFVMGVSATCDHCVPTSRWDGAIVSFRPDGSGLRVYASRIRAPVGLAYYRGTGDLFVSMDQRDDLGAATPGDWLSVVREGQDWRFPECYGQPSTACDGAPAPLAALDPHGAAGGVAIATGQLGPSVGAAALVAEWNGAKIQQIALKRTGSTFRASAVSPFLRGLSNPLALLFAPDGSLLAGDWSTGAIYRIAR